jgi:hypothetical protein
LVNHLIFKRYSAEEIFSSEFSQILKVKAPKVKLIEYNPSFKKLSKNGNEWHNIKNNINRIRKDVSSSRKISKELNRAFFMLMEFLPNSQDLGDINNEELKKTDTKYYYDMGCISILDIVINNYDRMYNF